MTRFGLEGEHLKPSSDGARAERVLEITMSQEESNR